MLDESGVVVLEQRLSTTPRAIGEVFRRNARSRIALENGMHSPWVSRLLNEFRHEVIVAYARDVRLIGESQVLVEGCLSTSHSNQKGRCSSREEKAPFD